MESKGDHLGREFALGLDKQDGLAVYREAFLNTDPDLIYLDGNSLGRLPLRTINRLRQAVEQEWGADLIRSWNADWYEAPKRIGGKIAPIIGADAEDVVVGDSTSVNLFKLAIVALERQPSRRKIISDTLNFPSDLYILQGCARLLGDRIQLHLLPSNDGILVDEDEYIKAIDDDTALVTFSHVAFKSGFLCDLQSIVTRAHEVGAAVLVDLSHSVGVVPIELDRWGVDFAVGCTYKYLNGGPGSPAFLYVHRDLLNSISSPIWGWWGQQSPFQFELQYQPAKGIERFLVGAPPILSLLAIEHALDLISEAGVMDIREKSVRLTSYLIDLFDPILTPLGFTLGTPRNGNRRGSHVSICHPEGYRISQALIEEMKLIPDFREPDTIRLGLAPLYTSFTEVWEAVDRIRCVVDEGRYLKYSLERKAVT